MISFYDTTEKILVTLIGSLALIGFSLVLYLLSKYKNKKLEHKLLVIGLISGMILILLWISTAIFQSTSLNNLMTYLASYFLPPVWLLASLLIIQYGRRSIIGKKTLIKTTPNRTTVANGRAAILFGMLYIVGGIGMLLLMIVTLIFIFM